MDKKELILTVAKDLIIANKMYHTASAREEGRIKDLGKILEAVVKEVTRVYNGIEV